MPARSLPSVSKVSRALPCVSCTFAQIFVGTRSRLQMSQALRSSERVCRPMDSPSRRCARASQAAVPFSHASGPAKQEAGGQLRAIRPDQQLQQDSTVSRTACSR